MIMKNIIEKLDFLKEKKTKIFTTLTLVVGLYNIITNDNINVSDVTGTLEVLFQQTEVIITSLSIIYGLVMKIVRKFIKTKSKLPK